MGIVKRQGIKKAVVSYVGTAIGALSFFFVYPLEMELYGYIQFIIPTAILLASIISLGIPSLTVRFFNVFENNTQNNNGFLGILLSGVTISTVIIGLIAYFFRDHFLFAIDFLGMDQNKFSANYWLIYLVASLAILRSILVLYSSNFLRIVVPGILGDLFQKISIPLIILLVIWGVLPEEYYQYGIPFFFLVSVILLLIYLVSLKRLDLRINYSILDKPLLKKMAIYATYGVMGSIGYTLAFRIDNIMVTSFTSYEDNGVYSMNMFLSNIIAIPLSAVVGIISPIIAKAWATDSVEVIKDNYTRSSLVLIAAGLFIFLGIWLSIDDLYALLPNDRVATGKYVFFFLGLAALCNVATGLNEPIIIHSKYFRFNVIAMLTLAFSNVIMNYYLIPTYLINGAAIATASSIVVFNVMKTSFIWRVYGFQPFSIRTVYVLVSALIAYGIAYIMLDFDEPIIDILTKSIVFSSVYLSLLLIFKIVPDFNKIYNDVLIKIRS